MIGDIVAIIFWLDLMRSELSKKWKLLMGIIVVDCALYLIEYLFRPPIPILWIRHWLSLLLFVIGLAVALIGIPLWFRSKIRYV